MKNNLSKLFLTLLLIGAISGCSSPAEKAEKYYQKGMELIEKNPDKAKLEFQNALQLKKNMTKAIYSLGLIAEAKGDLKGTFGLMNEVVEQDPKNINALVKTGQILLGAGKLDVALERSNRALEVDKNNVSALNLRAALQLKLNNPASAIENANIALSIDPNSQDAYVILAAERLLVKDNIKAIEYLDKALVKNNKNLAVQLIRIKALEDLSKVSEADQAFKMLIKLFPDQSFVRKNYAQFLLKYNRQPEAEQQLRAIAKTAQDLQSKLDIVRFVIATKGAEAGRVELESYVKNEPENYDLGFALVNLYQLQNNTTLEDQLLHQIAKKAGNTVNGYKAQSLIAYKLIKAGKKSEASKMLNTILAADKSFGQALTLRAGLALDAKDYDAAIIDLRTVLRDSPESSGVALMLATAHENSGSPELAEELYLRAFETSKFSPAYGVPYTQFLMKRKQTERAGKVYEQLIEANPTNATVIRNFAQFKIQNKDYVGAQELADKVKKLNEKSPLADQILGAISSSKNDFDATVSAFKRAHAAAPNESQPIAALVDTYVRAGKNKEALAFIKSVIDENPNNTDAKFIQGQLLSKIGDTSGALQAFADAIKLQPKNIYGYQLLASAQLRAKQNSEAEQTILQGLSIAPNDIGLKLTQAGLYEASDRYEDAIKAYEDIVKSRPDSEVVANNLASLLTDHRSDQASFNRAYTLAKILKNSEVPQFLDTFGWASYKVGKLDEAKKALIVATDKLPDVAVIQYHMGKVYLALNEPAKAKQALQNAIKYSQNQQFSQKDEANELLKSL